MSEPTANRSLYRRYRPRNFDQVVGQQTIVRTLRNAVSRQRLHHAYLFVGSRGTGKTSLAKILAASVNCERWRTLDACGTCASCRAIADGSSLDVIEMDAASHNSVEDVRELRERVAFAPTAGSHKVFILDEAHMLSQAAWNALLKTLEEPPPSTIFVLATTEVQKVPETIIDRCLRFDFHRPTRAQIADVVRRVAGSERIEVPDEAVLAIAQAADGSFRDALGTLEQLVTYGHGGAVSRDDVLAVLGVVDADTVGALIDATASGDGGFLLKTLSQLIEQGREPAAVSAVLEAQARELLIVQTLREVPAELSRGGEADEVLRTRADQIDRSLLVRMLDLIAGARVASRAGADARTQLELALVKAADPALDASEAGLLARLGALEARLPATD